MKALVIFSLLGLGSLVGCGGVEAEQPAGDEAVQSVGQAVCTTTKPSGSGLCKTGTEPKSIESAGYLSCLTGGGYTIAHYCPEADGPVAPGTGCNLWTCGGSYMFSGYSCAATLSMYCQ